MRLVEGTAFVPLLTSLLVGHGQTAAINTQISLRAEPQIPQYVYDYAPLVWLYSTDSYRPSDLQQQLDHTIAEVNWTAIAGAPSPLTLNNIDQLNSLGNTSVYLTTHGGIEEEPQPSWWSGITPDADGRTGDGTGCAIIVVDHGSENVDAFYFYFYAYNKGDRVLGKEFGDHIGDWEHNMIRFANGTPQAMWFSQHASGQAFTYKALEKKGKRPYSYSGNGTHANYAIAGQHDHTIPGLNLPTGLLLDHTNRGVLWDPTLNAYSYSYDPATGEFTGYAGSPVAWLNFNGKWGDAQPPGEPTLFGEAQYVAGPTGPKFKSLNRKRVCPSAPFPKLAYSCMLDIGWYLRPTVEANERLDWSNPYLLTKVRVGMDSSLDDRYLCTNCGSKGI